MGREEEGGFRMGNTCIPVADSFWYMAKPIQYCKLNKKTVSQTHTHTHTKEVNYLMARLSPCHKRPQFQGLTSRKWEQTVPGTKDWLYLNQSWWYWSDHRWPISRWWSELTVLFLQVALALQLWKFLPTGCERYLAFAQKFPTSLPTLGCQWLK